MFIPEQPKPLLKKLDGLFYAIFWVWNLFFLFLAYLILTPTVILGAIGALWNGEIQPEFLWPILVLILVPVSCVIVGARVFAYQPRRLIQLFYGVEAPLLTLAIIRLFAFRELSPAGQWVMVTCLLCLTAYAIELSTGYLGRRMAWFGWLQLGLNVLSIGLGVAVAILLVFYTIPVGWWLIQQIGRALMSISSWRHFGQWTVLAIVVLGFSLATATLFLAMPGALTLCYIESGARTLKAFQSQHGAMKTLGGSVGVLLAWTIIFNQVNMQPQVAAFEWLSKPIESDRDRLVLLGRSDTIRAGLTNAFLNGYRYLGASENTRDVKSMYDGAFKLPEPVLDRLQRARDALFSPFIYQGFLKDSDRAERLYAEFFDQPLQRQERDAIRHALRSTIQQDQAQAGLLNINDRRVFLRQQDITTTEMGDLAEIELHEVYANQTNDVEEIFYSFALPESATLTGLWLGDTGDRRRSFAYQISTRGAAQKVYKAQVQRSRPQDPALLEQVGPRQYRLRAFPIPPKLRSWERDQFGNVTSQRPTEMHLWLTYRVSAQTNQAGQRVWPLPELLERRNLFWSQATRRSLNGQDQPNRETWLPGRSGESFLPIAQSSPVAATTHQIDFPEGYRVTVESLPAERLQPQLANQRLAIIIDTSRSMADHRADLSRALAWLAARGLTDRNLANGEADLYLSGVAPRSPQGLERVQNFNPDQYVFFGKLDPLQLVAQFNTLQTLQTRNQPSQDQGQDQAKDQAEMPNYRAVILLTDRGSYELVQKRKEVPNLVAPLWLWHLGQSPAISDGSATDRVGDVAQDGGGLAIAYDDAMLYGLQTSGGGVTTDPDRILRDLASRDQFGRQAILTDDNYLWRIQELKGLAGASSGGSASSGKSVQPQTPTNPSPDQAWQPLAARQLIAYLSRTMGPKPAVADLDRVHAIAKRIGLVTPYSSAIVLVNDQQRQALKAAEARSDRFERTIETGKEALPNPNSAVNTTVPEPRPIAGLIVFLVGSWWFQSRSRRVH